MKHLIKNWKDPTLVPSIVTPKYNCSGTSMTAGKDKMFLLSSVACVEDRSYPLLESGSKFKGANRVAGMTFAFFANRKPDWKQ